MTPGSVKRLDVFFYETFEEEEEELRLLLGTTCSYECSSKTIQETGHTQPPARLISIRTQSTIPVSWSGTMGGVLSRSTGYDHLLAYQANITKPLPLGYLNEYASRAVAEQAILLALALQRKLPLQTKSFATFARDGLTGAECPGRNLLVVGVGRIGSEIYGISRALGFSVKGVDLVHNRTGVEYVSRDEGIAWADVIVCAMNLTGENRGYFSAELLKRTKPGSIFVNIARGELSPVRDLLNSLDAKQLGGVGLDVFENENILGAALRTGGSDDTTEVRDIRRLAAYPNVILTPHNAFNTREALRRKSQMSVDQVKHFLEHNDFIWELKPITR
ncbi:MAG TPA: NAD(P)-dependent oxidoreductase [Bacteroidota bacterium]